MLLQEAIRKILDNTLISLSNIDGYSAGLDEMVILSLVEALQWNNSLDTISLYLADTVSLNTFKALASVLTGHPNLRSVSINTQTSAGLNDTKRAFFVDMLEQTYGVTTLSLPFSDRTTSLYWRYQGLLGRNGGIIYYLERASFSQSGLGDNAAVWLAQRLRGNTKFEGVSFRDGTLTDEGAIVLAAFLQTLPNVGFVSFPNNQIGDRGAGAIAELVQAQPGVSQIDLTGNRIGDQGAIALAEAIKTSKRSDKVTSISFHLQRNQIKSAGAIALAEVMKTLSMRYYLYVNSNPVGDDGAIALADLPDRSVDKSFERMNIGARGISALANALQNAMPIRMVDFSNNPIGNEGAEAVARLFATNQAIYSISLYNTSLTAVGAEALVPGLLANRGCIYLSVNGNNIGIQGSLALWSAMQNNTISVNFDKESSGLSDQQYQDFYALYTYKNDMCARLGSFFRKTGFERFNGQLGLSNFPLRPIEFNRLLETLKTDRSAYSLDLSMNALSEAQVHAIAEMLRYNQRLQALTLSNNPLTEAGVKALAESVALHPRLETLTLYDCKLNDAAVIALANALKTRAQPLSISFDDPFFNTLNNTAILALLDILAMNPVFSLGITPNYVGSLANPNFRNIWLIEIIKKLKANSITSLDVYSSQLSGQKHFQLFSQALKDNLSLRHLSFYQAGLQRNLTIEELQALSEGLAGNQGLMTLDLSHMGIGGAGVAVLVEGIAQNPSLSSLSLVNNSITAVGAESLRILMQAKPALKALFLDQNPLGDSGVTSLALGLLDHSRFTTLSLTQNQFGNTGLQALINWLVNSTNIIYLNLRNNVLNSTLLAQAQTLVLQNQQYPSIVNNTLNITQGASVVLTGEQLSALNVNRSDYAPIEFNVTALERGQFFDRNNKTVRVFSQADIDAGQLRFQHDGSGEPPRYAVTARNRLRTSRENPAAILFRALPEASSTTSKPADSTISNTQPASSSSSLMLTTDKAPISLSFSNTPAGSSSTASISAVTPRANSTAFMLNTTTSTAPQITQSLTVSSKECLPCPLNNNTESQATGCSSNTGLMIGLGLTSVFGLLAMIAFFLLWMRYNRSQQRVGLTGHPRLSQDNTLPMQDNPVARRQWDADTYDIHAETRAPGHDTYESVDQTAVAPAIPQRTGRHWAPGLYAVEEDRRVTLRDWDPEHYDVKDGAPRLSNSRV